MEWYRNGKFSRSLHKHHRMAVDALLRYNEEQLFKKQDVTKYLIEQGENIDNETAIMLFKMANRSNLIDSRQRRKDRNMWSKLCPICFFPPEIVEHLTNADDLEGEVFMEDDTDSTSS